MFNYVLYRIGQFVALHLPLKLAYKLAIIVSDIRLFFARRDQYEVTENLKVIFPEKSDGEIKIICRDLFRNFAKYLADFFCFSKINNKFIQKNIRLKNLHFLDEAAKEGRGVIALTAHIGNWELGGAVLSQSGYPISAVALPHRQKAVDDFFNYQRRLKGVTVIPVNKAVRLCLSLLEQGKTVALVGDRYFNSQGVPISFFGRNTSFPEGPAAFSLKTGAPIVCGFMLRNADDTFTLEFNQPIHPKVTGDRFKDTRELMKQYVSIFEAYIIKYPDQWYMFRRFWV